MLRECDSGRPDTARISRTFPTPLKDCLSLPIPLRLAFLMSLKDHYNKSALHRAIRNTSGALQRAAPIHWPYCGGLFPINPTLACNKHSINGWNFRGFHNTRRAADGATDRLRGPVRRLRTHPELRHRPVARAPPPRGAPAIGCAARRRRASPGLRRGPAPRAFGPAASAAPAIGCAARRRRRASAAFAGVRLPEHRSRGFDRASDRLRGPPTRCEASTGLAAAGIASTAPAIGCAALAAASSGRRPIARPAAPACASRPLGKVKVYGR
jgi:hypothetical protein